MSEEVGSFRLPVVLSADKMLQVLGSFLLNPPFLELFTSGSPSKRRVCEGQQAPKNNHPTLATTKETTLNHLSED